MQHTQIVIINGMGGSGKDTFCDYFIAYAAKQGTKAKSISSVDKVKEIAKLCGWDGVSKTDKDRKFLSDLKDLTSEYSNFSMFDVMKKIVTSRDELIFVHIRETNDIQALYDWALKVQGLTPVTIRINRDVRQVTNNTGDLGALDDYPYSVEIDNNGTLDDLKNKAAHFYEEIMQGAYIKE